MPSPKMPEAFLALEICVAKLRELSVLKIYPASDSTKLPLSK